MYETFKKKIHSTQQNNAILLSRNGFQKMLGSIPVTQSGIKVEDKLCDFLSTIETYSMEIQFFSNNFPKIQTKR